MPRSATFCSATPADLDKALKKEIRSRVCAVSLAKSARSPEGEVLPLPGN